MTAQRDLVKGIYVPGSREAAAGHLVDWPELCAPLPCEPTGLGGGQPRLMHQAGGAPLM
jgi:hypothetical protein